MYMYLVKKINLVKKKNLPEKKNTCNISTLYLSNYVKCKIVITCVLVRPSPPNSTGTCHYKKEAVIKV